MTTIKRILITAGEPAGIGPDIILQMAAQAFEAELIVVGDPALLAERALQLNLPITMVTVNLDQARVKHEAGVLRVLPVKLNAPVIAGTLKLENAAYVIETLKIAADACLKHQADAVVTAPVHKGVINDAGIAFSGHTEFFADYCGVPRTLMLFVCDAFKVALATTHLPLSAVPAAMTPLCLTQALTLLNDGLKQWFNIPSPRLLVCGLNPHAGEDGHLGREELDVMVPCLKTLNDAGFRIKGPVSADTAFTSKSLSDVDAVLAMYHDQALPLVKYASFGHAVNVTLGLPFLRTSVDHGTALDVAGRGGADAGSLLAALRLAMRRVD
ncbi:MAG TPA: 4-hydroxythreonine-4-phosphate dehydrogenase PdxA [Gammaproteobacteria bacterium]|nr:4-hydroxythreonine-4-phosphate dehydrogenase PdxA [Gammaproteobacteria bacterium]